MSGKEPTAGSLWQFLRSGARKATPGLWESAGEGEQILREHLQDLSNRGFGVFHDRHVKGVPRDVVDAIVVGPTGVYVLDAKHWFGEISVENGVLYQIRGVRRERGSDVTNVLEAANAIGKVSLTYVQPLLVMTGEAQPSHGEFVSRVRLENIDGINGFISSQIHVLSDDVVMRVAQLIDEHFPARGQEGPDHGPHPVQAPPQESMPHPSSGGVTGVATAGSAAAGASASSSAPEGYPPMAEQQQDLGSYMSPPPGVQRGQGGETPSGGLHDTFVMPGGAEMFRQTPAHAPSGYPPVHSVAGSDSTPLQATSLGDMLRGASHSMRQQAAGMRLPQWRSRLPRRAGQDEQPGQAADDGQANPARKRRGWFTRLPLPSWQGVGLVSLLLVLVLLLGVLWVVGGVVGGMRRCPILSDEQASAVIGADSSTTRRFWGGGCSLDPDGGEKMLIFRDQDAQSRAEGNTRVFSSPQDCGLLVVAPRGARLGTDEPARQQQVPAAACVPVLGDNSREDAQQARERGLTVIAAIRRARVASNAGVDN